MFSVVLSLRLYSGAKHNITLLGGSPLNPVRRHRWGAANLFNLWL